MERVHQSHTSCPKCKYVREPDDRAPDYECPACGIIYAKYVERPTAQRVVNAVPSNEVSFFSSIFCTAFFSLAVAIVAEPAFPTRSLLGLGRLLGFDAGFLESFVCRAAILAVMLGFLVWKTGLHHKLAVGMLPWLMLVVTTACVLYIAPDRGGMSSLMAMAGTRADFYFALKNTALEVWQLLSVGYVLTLVAAGSTGQRT